MDAAASAAIDEKRSLTADEDIAIDQHRSAVAAIDAEVVPLEPRVGENRVGQLADPFCQGVPRHPRLRRRTTQLTCTGRASGLRTPSNL